MKRLLISGLLGALCAANLGAAELPKITYLDEYIVKKDLNFNNTTVGGLSSIDYANGQFYMISDHGGGKRSGILGEPRFYQAQLDIRDKKINGFEITSVTNLLPQGTSSKGVDPESLRVLADGKHYMWSSEGSVKHNVAPGVYINKLAQQPNSLTSEFGLPEHFAIGKNTGPHNNAVFEGLTLSHDGKGFWVAMEGPLKQDSAEPTLERGALVRISYFSFATKKMERQFVYHLDKLPNEVGAKANAFRTTGLVELVALKDDKFIVMERAYTSGLADGGNRVKLFIAEASETTDTKDYSSVKNKSVQVAKKQLWLDLADVQQQFPSKRVDNIEGITFGPKLPFGKQSLLLVSDDNFSAFGHQISQILLFEVEGL